MTRDEKQMKYSDFVENARNKRRFTKEFKEKYVKLL